jgi:hypothetical protein
MPPFIAKPFTCANPDQEESLGLAVSWIADNLRSEIILPVLKKHGIEAFDPNTWYRTQTLLDVMRALYKEPGTTEALVAIGKKSAEDYPFGPEVKTLEDAVVAFNQAHHTVHRGIHPEQGFLVERPQPNTLIVVNNNPWPGELIFGILWTFGRRFGGGKHYTVSMLPPDEYGRAVFKVSWD